MKINIPAVIISFALIFLLTAPVFAEGRDSREEGWCIQHFGIFDYLFDDGSKIECYLENHAVEIDYLYKWEKTVEQALVYSVKTGQKPGVVLILKDQKERQKLEKIKEATDSLGVTLWTITSE